MLGQHKTVCSTEQALSRRARRKQSSPKLHWTKCRYTVETHSFSDPTQPSLPLRAWLDLPFALLSIRRTNSRARGRRLSRAKAKAKDGALMSHEEGPNISPRLSRAQKERKILTLLKVVRYDSKGNTIIFFFAP